MKKFISLSLIFILLFQPLFSSAQDAFGLSILDPEDYKPLNKPSASATVESTLEPVTLQEVDPETLMQYSQEFWAKAVKSIDGDEPLAQELPTPITRLRPSFALPLYGTSISLTGKKTFGFKMDSKQYKGDSNATFSKSYSTNEFEQAMQIKMEGKIADRIFVDIDYDDQSDDTQTIAVSYKGKEGELVQSADFGDIELALPKTEFISFNKQLFGAKMHLQHNKANLRLIGSRTKGTGKSKQFKGASVFERINVADKDYTRRTYYDITAMLNSTDDPFGNAPFLKQPILRNSEEIYLYDSSTSSNNQNFLYQKDYVDLSAPADTGSQAKFRLLERGVDYNLDYTRNIIVFKTPQAEKATIAIDYTNEYTGQKLSDLSPGPGKIKLIKTENDRPRPETGSKGMHVIDPPNPTIDPEMKTIYTIGRQQIERDNGLGNFSLRLLDANGNAIGQSESPQQLYSSTITVDFDKGNFELKNKLNDASLYLNTPVSYRNLTFQIEIYSKIKSYYVEPGIVVQSETVKVDGMTLKRNTDYYIDYASGFITFYKTNLISENSTIDISYDTESGDQANSTLLGARFDYDFTDKIGIGATVLQEGGDKPQSAPNINATTESITVFEGDFKANEINVTEKLKVSASGEVAQSMKNKNLFGSAIIDNMDDIKQTTGISTTLWDWQISSNPSTMLTTANPMWWGSVFWDTEMVRSLDINTNASSNSTDTQPVLTVNYDFTNSDEVSIVYPMSKTGVDLSDFNNFELTALGETNGPQVNIFFGQVDERSDNKDPDPTKDFTLPCSPYYPNPIPKTEDLYCRGNISSAEDRGWTFRNPDGTTAQYDPFVNNQFNRQSQPNGRIDTQDLDDNGRLDPEDYYSGGSFGYFNQPGQGPGVLYKSDGTLWDYTLNNTAWATYMGTLAVDSDAVRERWTNIKQVRISLKKPVGGKDKGTIKIAFAALSGNAWQAKLNKENVLAKNSVDNADYVPIYNDNLGDGKTVFQNLYGSVDRLRSESRNKNIFEQTLAFVYDTSANPMTEVTAQRNFSNMDFSDHKEINFLLYLKNQAEPNSVFFARFGTEKNYQEVIVPLDNPNIMLPGRWKLITLQMADITGDHVPDILRPITPGVSVNVVQDATSPSNVNFKKISTVISGVNKTDGTDIGTGEVWFNELYVSDAVVAKGLAYRGDGKIEYEGWGNVGGTYKKVDDQFETPVSVATGQEITNQNYSLNFTRIKELPVTAGYTQDSTYTPVGLNNDNTNTVSHLDEGAVDKKNGFVRTQFNKPGLPTVGLEYNFYNASYSELTREDDSKTYSVNVSHNMPKSVIRDVSAGYSLTNADVNYSAEKMADPQSLLYNTEETTNRYSFRMNIVPWKGTSIAPVYSLSNIKEDKYGYDVNKSNYPKAMNQNAGFTSNVKIAKWLVPTLSYNVYTSENNNLTPTTVYYAGQSVDFDIGEIKNVNRSADGGVGLTLNFKEIFPKNKLLGGLTLSNSYKLQDADSWANVESGYDTKYDLWVRDDISPSSQYAYKRYMTLRDSYSSVQKWYPFKEYNFQGKASMLNSMSIFNTFTKTYQDTEETGTLSSSVSTTLPDVVVNIGEFEKLWGNSYWLSATNLKLRMTHIENEVLRTEERIEDSYRLDLRFLFINKFDTLFTYANKDYSREDIRVGVPLENSRETEYTAQTAFSLKSFRITPKLLYTVKNKKLKDNFQSEDSTNLNPSINVRLDVNMPGGIWIPFVNRNYAVSNRIIWNTTLGYQQMRAPLAVLDNKNVWTLDTSVDYEFSQNLRLTLSGGVQKYDSLYVDTESYFGYNASTLLTLQF